MKILFLTNLLPYPTDSGGKIKTFTTLKCLSSKGYYVDLVCFYEGDHIDLANEKEVCKFCNSVYQVPLKLTTAENRKYMLIKVLFSLLSRYSFGVYKFYSKKMKSILVGLIEENHYDCIYYDHLQLCVYRDTLEKICSDSKIIIDEHNCETVIMERNAKNQTNLIKRLFFKIEVSKLRAFEAGNLKTADMIIILSKEDRDALRKTCNSDFKHTIIPIGMQSPEQIKRIEEEDSKKCINILFLGTLTWAPNDAGICWYLENVMPLMKVYYKKFRLFIVGKNPSESLRRLSEQYNNVTVTGYVDSVEPYYEKCDFMIVPLFIGSGQRVKIIESFSKGMPVLSTSIGAEGLEYKNGENIIIANDAESFLKGAIEMCKVERRKQLSNAERELFKRYYSIDAVSNKICTTLDNLFDIKEEYYWEK